MKQDSHISSGWKYKEICKPSLEEVNNSISVPIKNGFWRRLFAFMGPGALVAVGYVDPGNWATSIAGGSRFGYALLSVILLSNCIAMLLQEMSARLGIATDMDLAQATRATLGQRVSYLLWFLTELAVIATDIAEVIGSAIALQLLFGIPLLWGVFITISDVLLLLLLQKKGFRLIEAIVVTLILTVLAIFAYEVTLSKPNVKDLLSGFIPQAEIALNSKMLFISLGILGATVMPHNLYLHSSLVQSRQYPRTLQGRKEALKFFRLDSFFCLSLAFIINCLILVLGAAAFHGSTNIVEEIEDAYKFLSPTLGVPLASTLFAVALLASGQNSTITGTLSGQIVMEGFLHIRLPSWLRRLITRALAILPVLIVTWLWGERGTGSILLWSQVILSFQLPFAVIPLVLYTSNRKKMGVFTNSLLIKILAWLATTVIIALNFFLIGYILLTGKDLG